MLRCLLPVALAVASFAQNAPAPTQNAEAALDPALTMFVRSYASKSPAPDEDTRYAYSKVSLSGRKRDEVIVYLMGRQWCGSGGCSALILEPRGSSYRLITKTTITQLPIRVLETQTNQWRDIGVQVSGGGIQKGYEARLRFNGRKYPSNPSVPPALHSHAGTRGGIVIPDSPRTFPLFEK